MHEHKGTGMRLNNHIMCVFIEVFREVPLKGRCFSDDGSHVGCEIVRV